MDTIEAFPSLGLCSLHVLGPCRVNALLTSVEQCSKCPACRQGVAGPGCACGPPSTSGPTIEECDFLQVDAAGDSVTGIGGVPSVVNAALAKHFPPGCGYDIIAEPGR